MRLDFNFESVRLVDFKRNGGTVPVFVETCSGKILMVAYVDEQLFIKTIQTREFHCLNQPKRAENIKFVEWIDAGVYYDVLKYGVSTHYPVPDYLRVWPDPQGDYDD